VILTDLPGENRCQIRSGPKSAQTALYSTAEENDKQKVMCCKLIFLTMIKHTNANLRTGIHKAAKRQRSAYHWLGNKCIQGDVIDKWRENRKRSC
jgi:hypothetical protein